MKTLSFMCEHTVEYALVHQLHSRIVALQKRVIPFYFWKTREGSSLSLASGDGAATSVCAVFPRRPKLAADGRERVIVKFNREVLEFAFLAKQVGIPVFAGAPLVRRIQDFSLDVSCLWFCLPGMQNHDSDIEIECPMAGEVSADLSLSASAIPLRLGELVARISRYESRESWVEIVTKIRNLLTLHEETGMRGLGFRSHWRFSYARYKPFYLLIENLHD